MWCFLRPTWLHIPGCLALGEWSHHCDYLGREDLFCIVLQFYHSCHLFLISSACIRSILFLSFIEPIFAWNIHLVSLISLKRSLVFSILLFSSICLHLSLRKAFLSLLAILSLLELFIQMGISFLSPLLLASLLFTAICKASSDSHFTCLHFLFLGMILIPVSCTMSHTSVHSSSGTLSIRYSPLNLYLTSSVLLLWIWFRSYLNDLVVFPTLFNLSLNLAVSSHDLSHRQFPVLFLLTVYSFSIFGWKNTIHLISVFTFWWCPCVSLLLCWWKRVFAMTSVFSWQNSISLCPASFCTPRPKLPVPPGVAWLPTFAF